MTTYEHLLIEQHGRVAVVTLNRPEKLNALNQRLREETVACFNAMELDDSVSVIVVTGAGRGFCAGADLTSGDAGRPSDAPDASQTLRLDEYEWIGHRAEATYRMTKPMIEKMLSVLRQITSARITPTSDSGKEAMIASGCRKLLN